MTCQLSRPTVRFFAADPREIGRDHHEHKNGKTAIEPDRQSVDGRGGFRLVTDTEAEDDRVAEPERQAGDESELGDIDDRQAVG